MTDKLKAQVSAFVDDELLEAESELLVRRLCGDEALRHTAARYTLIGDAIRGSLHEIHADLAGNIMRVIENEPLTSPAASRTSGFLPRALAGGLLAATVAAIAVFSLRPGSVPQIDAPLVVAEPGIVVPPDTDQVDPFRRVAAPPVRQAGNPSPLDRYLLRHNQYATTLGRQGVLTYRSMGVEGVTRSDDAVAQEQRRPSDRQENTESTTP